MNDEDWGLPFALFVPYSNTISDVDNKIRYATVDVGYDWWRGDGVQGRALHRLQLSSSRTWTCSAAASSPTRTPTASTADPDLRAGADGDRRLARAAAGHGRRLLAGAAPEAQRRGRLPAVRELHGHRRSRPAPAPVARGRPGHRRAARGDAHLRDHRRAERRRRRTLLVDVDDERRRQFRRRRHRSSRWHTRWSRRRCWCRAPTRSAPRPSPCRSSRVVAQPAASCAGGAASITGS